MYPECRHVLASGRTCNSPALAKSAWCYFHTRMHHRPGQREAARQTYRRPVGRFAALSAPSEINPNALTDTIDCGSYPVTQAATFENTPLDLPPLEETVSIQLALIDVLQTLDKIRRERKEEANTAIRTAECIRVRARWRANH